MKHLDLDLRPPEVIADSAGQRLAAHHRARCAANRRPYDPFALKVATEALWERALNRSRGDTRQACRAFAQLVDERIQKHQRDHA